MVGKKKLVLAPWKVIREIALFFAGVCGIAFEAIYVAEVRIELLAIYCGMCGLPLFMRADERNKPDD